MVLFNSVISYVFFSVSFFFLQWLALDKEQKILKVETTPNQVKPFIILNV
jgi:hypothetical protein